MFVNKKYKVLSKDGFKSFSGIQKIKKTERITIQFHDGSEIKCSLSHRLLCSFGWKEAKDIYDNDLIACDKGFKKVFHIEYEKGEFEFFDLLNVENHAYYTNDIISHNCEFLGSSNTLINSSKLAMLSYITPIISSGGVDAYENPIANHVYLTVVDTSRGSGIDYSAFIVFDITQIPYKIVAKYRDNEIAALLYPNIIYNVSSHFNKAYVLVETNDIGQQIADILHYDLEYDNVLTTRIKGRAGQKINSGFGASRLSLGVRTTQQVKRIGCANFKSLVESDKLIINDYDLLYELYRFIEHNSKYQAEEGEHDDLVMCCILFSWLVNQDYFKELSSNDARLELLASHQKVIEDDLVPFGFVDDVWNDPDLLEQREEKFII
jgi:hypothetical protein